MAARNSGRQKCTRACAPSTFLITFSLSRPAPGSPRRSRRKTPSLLAKGRTPLRGDPGRGRVRRSLVHGLPRGAFPKSAHHWGPWLVVEGAITKAIMAMVGQARPRRGAGSNTLTMAFLPRSLAFLPRSLQTSKRPVCWRVSRICVMKPDSQVGHRVCVWHLAGEMKRAGDENRTRVLSLGSFQIRILAYRYEREIPARCHSGYTGECPRIAAHVENLRNKISREFRR